MRSALPVRLTLALLVALAVSAPARAQLTPQEAVAAMGRGINLGNTLEPPREGAWNNGPAQERTFDAYAEVGFQTVRVPVRWDLHTGAAPPYAVDLAWMDRVEEVVDWGLDRGLYVILNAHHEDWLKQNYGDPAVRARFDSIWVQIAERFQNKPDRLLLEIINEPFGMTRAEVDDLNARILGIIRETNPTRLVIYSGNEYSNIPQLLAAAIPDDDYVIGYFHSYDPWSFAGLAQGTWGTDAQREVVRQRFSEVATWSEANGVPVIISEFGAIRPADFISRIAFYSTYVEEAVRHGFAFQVWDDGGDFRVLNRPADVWGEELAPLLHAYPDGPTALRVDDDGPVALSWQLRTVSDSLLVQRRRPPGDYASVARLAGDATGFTDTTAIGGQTSQYRVIARSADEPDRYSYPVEVEARPTVRSPFNGDPAPVPGTIEAEDFDEGGEGLTYHDTTPENEPGAYRTNVGVDIETRDTGGFQVTGIVGGEWLEYTVDVAEAGRYEITAYVAAVAGRGTFQFTVGGQPGEILRAPTTGDTQTLAPVSTVMTLAAGEQILRLDLLSTRPYHVDRIEIEPFVSTDAESPLPAEVAFRVFPNPVADHLVVVAEAGQVEVFDVLGQRVRRVQVSGGAKHRIPVEGLAPGTYLARLVADGEVVARSRFVKR